MSIYRLLIGGSADDPDIWIDQSSYKSGAISMITSVDVVGSELSIDELSADVDYAAGEAILFSPADYDGVLTSDGFLFATADLTQDLSGVEYGTPVWLMERDSIVAKLYWREATRIGVRLYRISVMSAVGFLDKQRHYGGVYNRIMVGDLLNDLIGGRFEYTVDEAVASEIIGNGWLPIDTRRANLHRLMFAMGITIKKDAAGSIVFTYLYDTDGTPVPPERIFLERSVDFNAKVTAVQVTEHAFFQAPGAAEEQLFDNTADNAVAGQLIEFDAPCYALRATTGLTIDDSGDNFAIVSGSGTLYGKKYAHETRTIRKEISGSTGEPRVITSDSDAMINALNSQSVANKLAAYYGSRRTARMTIKLSGEKAGDMISFTDALGAQTKGLIAQAATRYSTFGKAQLKVIEGYVPTGQGNFYRNRVVVTEDGSWTVPAGVTRIRRVLIGGADGGDGGYDGGKGKGASSPGFAGDFTIVDTDETVGYAYYGGNQGVATGGAAGDSGLQGKILITDIDVSPGDVLTFVIGAGGVGGARNGGSGTPGGDTIATLGSSSASSGDGQRVNGYVDPITGDVFALPGLLGLPGGDGGQTDTEDLFANNGMPGLPGGSAGEWSGGAGGSGIRDGDPHDYNASILPRNYVFRASGGGGGGAAYGANGSPGGDGTWRLFGNPFQGSAQGGAGGAGANALPHPKPLFGCGGGGGNGGGGGGNAAGGRTDVGEMAFTIPSGAFYPFPLEGGAGGLGSAGGAGGDGCAIIYY